MLNKDTAISEKARLYFPNIAGVRAIAAFGVIIHHIEQTKWLAGINNSFMKPAVLLFGSLGVILFFVLSGFLITYLLIAEKEKSGTVQIKKFYIRRLLRIWPLYFLIIIAGLFIFPYIPFFTFPVWSSDVFWHYGTKIILFFLILPNVSLLLYPPMPYMKQTWSIGVEEQFYLLWPIIIKFSKTYLRPLLIITFSFMMATLFLFWLTNKEFMKSSAWLPALNFIKQYIATFRVGSMAIGGIAAYIAYFKPARVLKVIFSPALQWGLYIVLILFLLKGVTVPYVQNEFYSALFALAIINLACNKRSVVSLKNSVFEYFGKISFGLYMYHPVAIILSLKIAKQTLVNDSGLLFNIILYISAIIITIVMAGLSYKYIEAYFLKFKDRFTPGNTGLQQMRVQNKASFS